MITVVPFGGKAFAVYRCSRIARAVDLVDSLDEVAADITRCDCEGYSQGCGGYIVEQVCGPDYRVYSAVGNKRLAIRHVEWVLVDDF